MHYLPCPEFCINSSIPLVRRLEDELSYWLDPVLVKFVRIFVNLGLAIHLSSCAYWRLKVILLCRQQQNAPCFQWQNIG